MGSGAAALGLFVGLAVQTWRRSKVPFIYVTAGSFITAYAAQVAAAVLGNWAMYGVE